MHTEKDPSPILYYIRRLYKRGKKIDNRFRIQGNERIHA